MDAQYTGCVGDWIDGAPTYRTIGSAITAAPTSAPTPVFVEVRGGRFHMMADGTASLSRP